MRGWDGQGPRKRGMEHKAKREKCLMPPKANAPYPRLPRRLTRTHAVRIFVLNGCLCDVRLLGCPMNGGNE